MAAAISTLLKGCRTVILRSVPRDEEQCDQLAPANLPAAASELARIRPDDAADFMRHRSS